MAIIKLQGEAEKERGIYYEVDSSKDPIGEGGTGKVFEGRQVNTKTNETRPVAIKFMFADLSDQIVERARRESSVQLRNDNLIEMLGFIETETIRGKVTQKRYHVVSELLCGVSLTDIFDGKCCDVKGNEIPYAKKLLNIYSKDPDHFAKIIAKNVLSGLMALHDAGFIHRDIDPSNIMITDDEHIKLSRILQLHGKHFLQKPKPLARLYPVHRGDETGIGCPGIRGEPARPAQGTQIGCIDNSEVQTELLPHLVLPFQLQSSRADDEDGAGAVTYQKFLQNKPRLDGLSQADVIRYEQIDAGHVQGAHQRI